MKFGERQVAPERAGIRRDHVARYEFAAERICGMRVIDAGCGVGYGAQLLAEKGLTVFAFDADPEALAYADEHYAHHAIRFERIDATAPPALPASSAAVAFEIVEHLADPRPLLKALRATAKTLLASVPNEAEFPHEGRVKFHHRHYTRAQFERLLAECGWKALEWHGQADAFAEVQPGARGRTIIAICERAPVPTPEELAQRQAAELIAKAKAPDVVPAHVTILGLGPSLEQYVNVVKRLGGRHAYCDEVWGINAVGGVLQCDRIFHMDDVRVQQVRAAAAPESNIARMLEWLRTCQVPVITSRPHPDYPALQAFPLREVLQSNRNGYFNSTAAYAVAYAIWIGVKKISLFGIDFTYPDAHDAEKGRACVEWWLGLAAARGIKLAIAKQSTLMDALHPQAERFYGYDTLDLHFSDQDGALQIEMTERQALPTAEEIEARYDHTTHPSALAEHPEAGHG
jgi:SAM-dependent methyltransferase